MVKLLVGATALWFGVRAAWRKVMSKDQVTPAPAVPAGNNASVVDAALVTEAARLGLAEDDEHVVGIGRNRDGFDAAPAVPEVDGEAAAPEDTVRLAAPETESPALFPQPRHELGLVHVTARTSRSSGRPTMPGRATRKRRPGRVPRPVAEQTTGPRVPGRISTWPA